MKFETQKNEQMLLPSMLAEVITPQHIAENEARLLSSVPEAEPSLLQKAQDQLLELFLIHATDEVAGFRAGIVPHKYLVGDSDMHGNTFNFDQSLGLDECTFFSWPKQQHTKMGTAEHSGRQLLLVDANLLLDSRCFVTPRDLYETARVDEDEFGNPLNLSDLELEQREAIYEYIYDGEYIELQKLLGDTELDSDIYGVPREQVKLIAHLFNAQLHNLYFNQLVSGKAWLEFVARKILADGTDSLPLGEIKYFGTVDSSRIKAQSDRIELKHDYEPHVDEVVNNLG